ncbi:MAG: sugar ABC transporter permease [Clostridia bacterium]|nr:sugar ABC transporter permease [Clostridia bacterium]
MFLAPFLILFALFTLIPVIVGIILSFTNYNMIELPSFVGISNYKLLVLDDKEFIIALKNTFTFAFISGPLSLLMSFVLAWLINGLRATRQFYALAIYAPSIVSGTAISVVWLYFFSGDAYGLLNNFLMNLGIISEPIQWTTNPEYILTIVIFVSVWMGMGTGFLTFLAAFRNMSEDQHEAAMIDGIRNNTQELFYIILPQMKPQLLFAAINSSVGAFGVFDIATAIAGFPSPNYAAHTIVAHLYDYAFIRFEMGYASAVAVFLFAITYLLGKLLRKVLADN